jgi:D-psicose/D-tagatose/L-ribulose 3-epimerase
VRRTTGTAPDPMMSARTCPGPTEGNGKGRPPWHEIGTALRDIGYSGAVVMEPFVKTGGGVGSDIKVWRDLSDNADAQMDEAAREAVALSRYVLG